LLSVGGVHAPLRHRLWSARWGAPASLHPHHLSKSLTTQGVGCRSVGPPTLVDAIPKAGGITFVAQTCSGWWLQRRLPRCMPTPASSATRVGPAGAGGATVDQSRILALRWETRSSWRRVSPGRCQAIRPSWQFHHPGSDGRSPSNVIGEVKSPDGCRVPARHALDCRPILAAAGVEPWRAKTVTAGTGAINRNGARPCAANIAMITTRDYSTAATLRLLWMADTVIVIARPLAISGGMRDSGRQPAPERIGQCLTLFRLPTKQQLLN